MTPPERWLIATDLDGTLFDHSLEISARVRRTMAAAQAAGHAVTVATGRMFRSAQPIAESLGIDQPLICYQGALIRQGERILYHRTLPLPVAHDALAMAHAEGIHVNAYVADQLFVAAPSEEAAFYLSLGPSTEMEVVGDLRDFLTEEPTKLVFIRGEAEIDQLLPVAVARWGAQAQVVRSHPRFVELTHPAASKGAALLNLAQTLGIPRERTLAIGDNLNDLSMIQAAGVGVAMGNAVPALQAAAAWIAPPLWEDGFAAAVERFVLGGHDEGRKTEDEG